jgi:hypothetical protein
MKLSKMFPKQEERFADFTARQERDAMVAAQEKRKKRKLKRLSHGSLQRSG